MTQTTNYYFNLPSAVGGALRGVATTVTTPAGGTASANIDMLQMIVGFATVQNSVTVAPAVGNGPYFGTVSATAVSGAAQGTISVVSVSTQSAANAMVAATVGVLLIGI